MSVSLTKIDFDFPSKTSYYLQDNIFCYDIVIKSVITNNLEMTPKSLTDKVQHDLTLSEISILQKLCLYSIAPYPVQQMFMLPRKSYSAFQVFTIPIVLLCMGKFKHQLRASRNGASTFSLCRVNPTLVALHFQGICKSVL